MGTVLVQAGYAELAGASPLESMQQVGSRLPPTATLVRGLRTRRAAVMNKHSNAVGEQCYESDYIDGNQNLPRPYPLHKGRSILKEGGFGFH